MSPRKKAEGSSSTRPDDTAIRVSKDLRRRLKDRANKEDTTLYELVEEYLWRGLKRLDADRKAAEKKTAGSKRGKTTAAPSGSQGKPSSV